MVPMVQITPEILKRLRNQRRLTLDQLAEKAHVDKQTIHRLERGQRGQARGTTVSKLAKALGVGPEALTGPAPDERDSTTAWEPNKSQINVRISDQARNALLLVCERYRVRPTQIVELAPLLFNWAAEKSLRQRGERIDALQQRESEISKELERFSSELGNLVGQGSPEIELPDWLNEFWSDQELGVHFRALFSDHEYAGPIEDLLGELASEIGDDAEFAGWHASSSPSYSICKEEATWLANSDEVALENILQGYAPLHELPKEFWEQLRNRNTLDLTKSEEADAIRQRQAAERVEWLRAHGRSVSDDASEAAS
jgi:transcriptional regulator with XRE-family HTH domain